MTDRRPPAPRPAARRAAASHPAAARSAAPRAADTVERPPRRGTAAPKSKRRSPASDRVRREAASERPRRSGSSAMLTATVLALNVVGLVMVMSASSVMALANYGSSWVYFNRQLLFTATGLGLFFLMARIDYRSLRRLSAPLLVGSIGLLFLVFVPSLGVRASGSSRWIALGPLNLQPSELAKLAVLLFSADVMARRADVSDDWRLALRPILLVFGFVAMLVMKQPDMGTTIVMGLIVATLLFAGGTPLRQLLPIGGVAAFGAVVLAFAEPYRRARLLSFLDPFHDPGNTGYQAVQSLIAFGSGGWFGVGLGAGRAKWLFLPNAHTDFIFAIIGEELGLLGAFLVVALFVALAVVGFRTAGRAPDRFGFLLASGITVWIAGQAIINMGAAIGLLPITGVPLPFVSFGGTALLSTMTAAGVLLNIARQSVPRPAGAPRTKGRAGSA